MYKAFFSREARDLTIWGLKETNRFKASKIIKVAQKVESKCRANMPQKPYKQYPIPLPPKLAYENNLLN
jgi:hypothetical protein